MSGDFGGKNSKEILSSEVLAIGRSVFVIYLLPVSSRVLFSV